MKQKKSASILKKFLLFNFTVFSILGLFTIIYLEAIQPTLINDRSSNHKIVINNTKEKLERLNIDYTKKGIREFLLSTRFLFQSLDRVQFYDLSGNLIGDTNVLDLDQSVFSRSEIIFEEIIGEDAITPEIEERLEEEEKDKIKDIIVNKYDEETMTLTDDEKNNFIVSTLSKIKFKERDIGYIVVSEQANDIITAVKERKAFIIRTMIAVAIVILIFSLFLNKYILKPIGQLVKFSEAIKKKSNHNLDMKKVFIRDDEIGKLTLSIDEMTKELQQRTNRAETFSNDLAHEIRNPLASLKSASELLDKTTEKNDSEKLLKIINHDVERIERLITDYSQMLKDEASLSREKMSKIIGIDLGTTYSAVAQLDDLGNPEVLSSTDENRKITASNIYVSGDKVVVGDKALDALTATPKNVISETKRQMENDVAYSIEKGLWVEKDEAEENSYTPAQVSSCLLYTSPSPRDRQKSRMPSSA